MKCRLGFTRDSKIAVALELAVSNLHRDVILILFRFGPPLPIVRVGPIWGFHRSVVFHRLTVFHQLRRRSAWLKQIVQAYTIMLVLLPCPEHVVGCGGVYNLVYIFQRIFPSVSYGKL